ncbi:MAG: protein BatD, partial [Flavobacterium sp.]|nr:protein BatD [Flavobacterium sp.]
MKQLAFFIVFIAQFASAQVKFEADVSKNSLGINERVRIEFSMNEDGDNFNPPNFEACGFRVVGGPSQSISQSWINGRSTFQKAYTYILLPIQKGNLIIKQATIEINGQIYKTSPLKMTVGNAVQMEQERNPNDAPVVNVDNNLYLVADISKVNPYVNEPTTVVYKLYFSNNIGISNFREVNKPKYNDFWSQNIEIKKLEAQQGIFKGQQFRFVILKKVILYPQKAGKLDLEPLALDIDVQMPMGRPNIFGQYQMGEDTKRVSAGNKIIVVKALPDAGKPADFTGAVGKFDFNVTPSRTNLKAGESLSLNISVSGTGNLKLFTLPKPVVPPSLEMYDPEHKENIQTPLSGMTGSITDNYTIIPSEKGNFPIKGLRFSYFDLSSQTYKTITSNDLAIIALEGAFSAKNAVAASHKVKVASSKTFAFIKQKTKLSAVNKPDFLGSQTFYALFALPFLIIPCLVLFRRKKEARNADFIGNRIKKSNALAKKYLSEAKKQINNKEPFYIALEKAMHNFLKAKLSIETFDMS